MGATVTPMLKRFFDLAVALSALVLLSPILILVGAAIAITSGLPVLFTQVRVGRANNAFVLYKFRTMRNDDPRPRITTRNDQRITPLGNLLRKTKVDELPQLVNVIKGDMSLVGPRPEVPEYVEQFSDSFATVLTVRPGLTGAASVVYRNEAAVLEAADDPLRCYVEEVLPHKLEIEIEYVKNHSLGGDLRILVATFASILGTKG